MTPARGTPDDTRGRSSIGLQGSIPDSRFPIPDGWGRGRGYAHAIQAEGRVIALAGQIGWDHHADRLVAGGFVAQVRQALANIVAILEAAGAGPAHLVRLTWFVTDRDAYLREQSAIGGVYRDVVGRHFPAMSVIIVAGLVEAGAEVEIEATAVVAAVVSAAGTSANAAPATG